MSKFNAGLEFDYKTPFLMDLKERTPLICAFGLALANFNLYNYPKKKFNFFKKPFVAVECGVYKGTSLISCSKMARDFGISFKYYGLDTFEGLPELSAKDIEFAPKEASYLKRKLFGDTKIEKIVHRIFELKLHKSVILKKGLFSDTLPTIEEPIVHFLNIDCDLYEGHLETLNFFYPKMATGGVVFFDDYFSEHYPMARQAIDHFMLTKNEKLIFIRHGDDGANQTKAFFIKE